MNNLIIIFSQIDSTKVIHTFNSLSDYIIYFTPLVFGYLGIKFKEYLIDYKQNKYKLEFHSLFGTLKSSINELKRWSYPANRQVFIDAFTIKADVWINSAKELAKKLDKTKIKNNSHLENIFNDWANDTIVKYEKEWKDAKINDKIIKAINKQHEIKVNSFIIEIKSIAHNNDAYITQKSKYIAIFDALKYLLTETKLDFSDLIYKKVYNGNMVGVIYKGLPVSDVEYSDYLEEHAKLKQ